MKPTITLQNIHLRKDHAEFLDTYRSLGFQDESALIEFAIGYLRKEITRRNNKVFDTCAKLFLEMYSDEIQPPKHKVSYQLICEDFISWQ